MMMKLSESKIQKNLEEDLRMDLKEFEDWMYERYAQKRLKTQ